MVPSSLSKPLAIAGGVVAVAVTFYGGTLIGQASNPSQAIIKLRPAQPVEAARLQAPIQTSTPAPAPATAPPKAPEPTNTWKTEVKTKTDDAVPAIPPAPAVALPKLTAPETPKARLDPATAVTAAVERLAGRRKDVSALTAALEATKSASPFPAGAWNDLAAALTGLGELDAAIAAAEHVIASALRIEETAERARASGLLAEIAERQGEKDNLERHAVRAVELARDAAKPEIVAVNLVRLADLQLKAGDATKAEALLMEARTAAFSANNPRLGLSLQMRAAVLARKRGDLEASFALLDSGLKASHALQLTLEMADFYAQLGNHYAAKGERDDAVSHWRAAREQYEAQGLKAKAKEMAQLLKSPEELAAEQRTQPVPAPVQRKPVKPVLRKSS